MRWVELRGWLRQHRHKLAPDIDIGIIVMSKFRSSDSGPNEDDLPGNRHPFPVNVSTGHEIRTVTESQLPAPSTEDQRGFSSDSLPAFMWRLMTCYAGRPNTAIVGADRFQQAPAGVELAVCFR